MGREGCNHPTVLELHTNLQVGKASAAKEVHGDHRAQVRGSGLRVWGLGCMCRLLSNSCKKYMGGCQNYSPLLVSRTQQVTIILTTNHIRFGQKR